MYYYLCNTQIIIQIYLFSSFIADLSTLSMYSVTPMTAQSNSTALYPAVLKDHITL